MTDRNLFIEDVKRRLDEFKTAPPDEKPYTEYAHFTVLIHDIERLLDILGIERKPVVCTLCGSSNTTIIDDSGLYGCHGCGEEFRPGKPHHRYEMTSDENGSVDSKEIEIPVHPKARSRKIVLSDKMKRILACVEKGEVIWKFKTDSAGAWRNSHNYVSERTINGLISRGAVITREYVEFGQTIPRLKLALPPRWEDHTSEDLS